VDFRATLMFQFDKSKPPAGFSETWEFQASTEDGACEIVTELANERGKILSEDWAIIGSRLATLGLLATPPAKIVQTFVSCNSCILNNEGELGASDTVQSALRYKIAVFPNVVYPGSRPKQYMIRGIPDTWWNAAEINVPKADDVKINAFLGYIIAKPFGHFVVSDLGAITFVSYRNFCGPFPANRKIGRPFGLLVGRRSCPTAAPLAAP